VCPVLRYTLEPRVFLYETYVKYGSAKKCQQEFQHKFHHERVTSRQTIHNLVNKLQWTGLSIDKKQKHKRWVLSEEKLKDIGATLEYIPRKSMKHLAQETGVSKSSASASAMPCSHTIQLAGFIFSIGLYSLSTKVWSIHNWHSSPSSESWCLVCCPCKDCWTCILRQFFPELTEGERAKFPTATPEQKNQRKIFVGKLQIFLQNSFK
jgi:hypothetical protein